MTFLKRSHTCRSSLTHHDLSGCSVSGQALDTRCSAASSCPAHQCYPVSARGRSADRKPHCRIRRNRLIRGTTDLERTSIGVLSCVTISSGTTAEFVTPSPYVPVFDALENVASVIDDFLLARRFQDLGMIQIHHSTQGTPGGKTLIRQDFSFSRSSRRVRR